MNFQILDKNFSLEEAIQLLKSDNNTYSKLFRKGYTLECWSLFKAPSVRHVGGLEEIKFELKDNTIKISYPSKYSNFAALILGIEYCNDHETIKNIKLNEEIKYSIYLNELKNFNNITITYNTIKDANIANLSVYYIISPYKNDDYYLNKEMNSWIY